MLKTSLYDYSDVYILVKGTIIVPNTAAAAADPNNKNKEVIFKNCAPFTDCISEINNTQLDKPKDIGVVMPIYNLIEYSNDYLKTSESLWQYCRDEPALTDTGAISNFSGSSTLFKFKQK